MNTQPTPGATLREAAPNPGVGLRYAALAALLLIPGVGAWPGCALLLWPAAALGWVAAGYLGAGARVYGKAVGRLPLARRWLLAPARLGQELSRRHYRRRANLWDPVVPGLLMGGQPDAMQARALVESGVTAVLDLTAEFTEPEALRRLSYCNLPVLDLAAPTIAQLDAAVAFISRHASTGNVYVHCKAGYSRSAAACAAWLLATGWASDVAGAVDRLRTARPSLVIRPEVLAVLQAFARHRVISGGAGGTGEAGARTSQSPPRP